MNFAARAAKTFEQRQFTVSLAGGRPRRRRLRKILAQQPEKISWDKVYIFFGDERCVPLTSGQQLGMARAALLAHVQFPSRTCTACEESSTPPRRLSSRSGPTPTFSVLAGVSFPGLT